MKILLSCEGGTLALPASVMVSRENGGNLCVSPPVDVWDRSELSREQLMQWSFLVAACGRAMLDVLPQLQGGIINYWDAGNWALNDAIEPRGLKVGSIHKKTHLHLLGRSPASSDKDWMWGEAPIYPLYKDAKIWMDGKTPLTQDECRDVVGRTTELLTNKYGVDANKITYGHDVNS